MLHVRDTIFIGGGPAALQGAIYLRSEGIDTLILEADRAVGGRIRQTPRVDNLFGHYGESGYEITSELEVQYDTFQGAKETGALVTGLSKSESKGIFSVKTPNGVSYLSRSVVIASGLSWSIPTEQAEMYNDFRAAGGDFVQGYKNEIFPSSLKGGELIIIGGGNSAVQAGVDLLERGHRKIFFVCRSGLKCSQYLLDQLNNKYRNRFSVYNRLQLWPGSSRVFRLGDDLKVYVDNIFYMGESKPNTGFIFNKAFLDEKGFVIAPDNKTAVPGIYAIGDVKSGNPQRCMVAVGDGGRVATQVHEFLKTNKHPKSTTY